jgi:hypothetical protein
MEEVSQGGIAGSLVEDHVKREQESPECMEAKKRTLVWQPFRGPDLEDKEKKPGGNGGQKDDEGRPEKRPFSEIGQIHSFLPGRHWKFILVNPLPRYLSPTAPLVKRKTRPGSKASQRPADSK